MAMQEFQVGAACMQLACRSLSFVILAKIQAKRVFSSTTKIDEMVRPTLELGA